MDSLDTLKGANTTYLHTLQTACHRHPSLKLLQTLPLLPEHPSRVKVLEFRTNGIHTLDIFTLAQLSTYWNTPTSTTTTQPTCNGRLYLIEDISLPWISLLAAHFVMDPRFFSEYLKLDLDRTQNFFSGYHTMRRLPSLRCRTSFSTFVYHEIRTFEGAAPRREEFEIRTRDNVGRLVTTVDHHCGRSTGLVRRNLGAWWRKGRGGDGGEPWDAVILVDPGASGEFLLRRWSACEDAVWSKTSCGNKAYLDGYLDFSAWPPVPQSQMQMQMQDRSSILDDIAHYWQHASRADRVAAHEDPREALLFAHRITASHWNLQLEYLVSVVSDLEKGLLKFEQMDAHPRAETIIDEVRTLRTLLSDVNSWRRRVYFYLEQMRWNIEGLCVPAAGEVVGRAVGDDETVSCEERFEGGNGIGDGNENGNGVSGPRDVHPGTSIAATLAHNDLAPLLTSLRLTQQRIQSLLPVVMGAFSLLEAQHSVLKADLTIRLSSVALIFVPLSFTASLLSMSDNFLPGKNLFWVFWAVSVPLILGLFWWAYWVQMGQVKRVGMKEMARKFRKSAEHATCGEHAT